MVVQFQDSTAEPLEIVLLSSGHAATDARVFDKEAVTLAKHFPHVRVVAAHPANEVRDGVHITALRPCRNRLQRFLLRPLECFLAARKARNRVLILHDAELLAWVPFFRAVTGWRIIYDVHEDFAQLVTHRSWIPAPLRKVIGQSVGKAEKLLARSCDGIIGVTEVLTDYFAPHKRVAIYNLPSREFIAASSSAARALPERHYDVVHLGTFSESRLEFFCSILEQLFLRKPEATALVLGLQPAQMTLLRQRFPEERVTAVGKIDYRRVAHYLGDCRIGINVHPVLHPHLRCAIPVKVFEYMASGCNVVTSFLPELHGVLGEEGTEHVMTIYTASVERFAEEITRLLEDPATLQRHQEALMRLVNTRWNWDHEGEKLVQFVTNLLPGKEPAHDEQVLNHQC